MTLLVILCLFLLAILGTPLFVIIGGIALMLFLQTGEHIAGVLLSIFKLASSPTLIAIPLFTFAGYLMAESHTPQRLVRLARAVVGWLPGGIAIVALIACAFFTAFTGASGVTIIALGGLLYPILLKEKYPEQFSLGLLTTSGSLGLLFPPSLPLILYGLVSETNIDHLFIAGIIPGILLIVLLSMYSVRKGIGSALTRFSFSWRELAVSIREAIWEIPLPFIILGGIYSGFITASEAAAVTAFYVLVIEVFVYRELHLWRDVPEIVVKSMVLVGGIIIILGCALGLTEYLVLEQVPMRMFDYMQQYVTNKWAFLLLLNGFLLIVGCLMDIFSAIIVVVPLILPIALQFGVDPVHLGIIFLTNLEIGYSTPPVGINLFISSFRFQKPVLQLYWASLPFLGILLLALLIITYVPALSLFLVQILTNY